MPQTGFKKSIIHLHGYASTQDSEVFKNVLKTLPTLNKNVTYLSTLTSDQMKVKKQVKMLEDCGFRPMTTHTNPNTGRVITSWIRPALVKGTKMFVHKDFYESDGMTVTYHNGGCCGFKSVIGYNPSLTYKSVRDAFGSGVVSYGLKVCMQLIVPTEYAQNKGIFEDEYTDWNSLSLLNNLNFVKVATFMDGQTNISMDVWHRAEDLKVLS